MVLVGMMKLPRITKLSIDMLSVGQGDGIVVRTPEGVTFLIDGGSTSNDSLGEYVLLPYLKYYGIDHIDYWMISHMDEDHYNGGLALIELGYSIDNVVVARASGEEKAGGYDEVETTAKAAGAELLYIEASDRIGAGSVEFSCLYPGERPVYDGTNENSVVLWLTAGDFDMIFTGDLGEDQERYLLDDVEMSGLFSGGNIEVLKTAHHGSKYSNCSEWLMNLSPELCVISAGKYNSYGHPSPDTISRMDSLGISHLCTIDCGEISIQPEADGRFKVTTQLSRPGL